MATIALVGGGSGGHIYPNLALVKDLSKKFNNIIYIGENGGMEDKLAKQANLDFYGISAVKLRRELTFKNLYIPKKLKLAVADALKVLKETKPDIIFLKGGYVCVPVAIAAKKLMIPFYCHESDYTIGLSNYICCIFKAKACLTSFSSTKAPLGKQNFVGSPLSDRIREVDSSLSKTLKFSNDLPTLLIMGGSLGAKSLNKIVDENIVELTKSFNILHLRGKNNLNLDFLPIKEAKDSSERNIANNYKQFESTDKIGTFYNAADIVISRGGANSLFELASLNLPTLIVPLPKRSSRGDQILNAKYFSKMNLMEMLLEEKAIKTLPQHLFKTYYKSSLLKNNLKSYNQNNANEVIAEILHSEALNNKNLISN